MRQTFRFPHLAHKRNSDDVRSSLDGDAHFQTGVAADLHVLLPRVIAGKSRLAVTFIAGGRRTAFRFSADGETLQEPAVQTDIESLRPSHPFQVILILALQTNLKEILAIDREVVMDGQAAARSERQVFVLPVLLQDMQRDLESVHFRLSWRQARREPRDLARDGEVSLHVRGRDGQGIGKVVEAAVRGFIARQLRPDIDVELQEIADRVVVFRAVQALDGADAARIRVRRPCAIDFVFQPQRHRSIGRRIRPRPSRRRHRTGT